MPTAAATLDLPDFDPADITLNGTAFHDTMHDLAARSWLARIPFGYLTLDREAGEFFLRTRAATFPGQLIAALGGVEDGPLRQEIDRNILHVDGADHQRLRNLLNPSFTPRAADRWRPAMREILASLLDPIRASGSTEFVETIAKPYPSLTIATVMGAPATDAMRLHEWSAWIQRQFDAPSLISQRDRIEQAVVEFYEWCDALIDRRRRSPGDDLISTLIAAEAEGDRLNDVELVNLVLDVLIGGVDTTQSQLAHAMRLFATHPEQWQLLGKDPELVPRAVDEVLRHEPVTPFTARLLVDEVEYRDITFPAGTLVMVCSFTGNRDGTGPAEFDITADRPAGRVMTFGAGIHFCVGANLARAELQEALRLLAVAMPGLRLDGDVVLGTVQGIYGIERLPLAWDTA
ncbi:MAG: hypothetical protein QOC82_1256 [Frankiaceae bacterium]|jgi:cytochrome P450|nr:hypothetical protein [Frankiaceae bacterium]